MVKICELCGSVGNYESGCTCLEEQTQKNAVLIANYKDQCNAMADDIDSLGDALQNVTQKLVDAKKLLIRIKERGDLKGSIFESEIDEIL